MGHSDVIPITRIFIIDITIIYHKFFELQIFKRTNLFLYIIIIEYIFFLIYACMVYRGIFKYRESGNFEWKLFGNDETKFLGKRGLNILERGND